MAVSDLTGTTWIFNNSIDLSGFDNESFYLNYSSNNVSYSSMHLDAPPPTVCYMNNNEVSPIVDIVYTNNAWEDQAYRTIEITGGTDVTNATLIAWLEANAVQQVPTVDTTSSFSDIALTSHEGYITLTIDNVDFNINATEVVNNNEEVSLISFTIDGTTYQAEQGMTWAQWVASAYNTGGYTIIRASEIGRSNQTLSGSSLVDSSNTTVDKSDLIIANEQYIEAGAGYGD